MHFIGIVIVPVLLLNVLIVMMCKRKDFERYIFVDGNSYKKIFLVSANIGTSSSII